MAAALCVKVCEAGALTWSSGSQGPVIARAAATGSDAVGIEAVADRAIERLLTLPALSHRVATVPAPARRLRRRKRKSRARVAGWNQRAFVALAAAMAGLGVLASIPWPVAMGVCLVLFCTRHAVLNRRALLRYLRGDGNRPVFPTREAIAAFVLICIVIAATLPSLRGAP